VKFKNAVGGDITLHPSMRVDYSVSGGCTISETNRIVLSGQVIHSYVINDYVGSCVFSFEPFFGSTSNPSIHFQPNPIIWTVIAKSIVFTLDLAASPLTGGAEYPFTGLLKYIFLSDAFIAVLILMVFFNAVALRNHQDAPIFNHVSLMVTPSTFGQCRINIAAKTVNSGGIFDYSSSSGDQGKVIFTNYIGNCVLRLLATFSTTAGSVTAGEPCTASNPSAPDQTRQIKASSVSFVSNFPNSIIGGQQITYSRNRPFYEEFYISNVTVFAYLMLCCVERFTFIDVTRRAFVV
jgi:hypothetical protein